LERSALSRISMPESATFIVILLYFVGLEWNLKLKKILKSNSIIKVGGRLFYL
jgi:hypothetical protein